MNTHFYKNVIVEDNLHVIIFTRTYLQNAFLIFAISFISFRRALIKSARLSPKATGVIA